MGKLYAVLLFPVFASAQTPRATVQLAETGHCREALPQLKKTLTLIQESDLKRRAGIAGVRCSMNLNDAGSALSFLATLNEVTKR